MDSDKTSKDFVRVLFEENETICLCPQTRHYGNFHGVNEFSEQSAEFFVINPIREGRSDSNVTAHRNILVEIDDMSLRDQVKHLKELNMPFSTMVYSGGKSFHYIISLEEPLSNKEIYEFLVRWIYNIIASIDPNKYADTQNKNPSRLSRFPNAIREETGRLQKLIYLKGRVKTDDLLSWLKLFPQCKPGEQKPLIQKNNGSSGRTQMAKIVDWYVQTYLKSGYQDRHTNFYQCPICAEEGRDNSKDNLAITGDDRFFWCFANEDHNRHLAKKLYALKRDFEQSKKQSSA